MKPPAVAMLLMRLLLPRRHWEAIAGDLEEEWNFADRPSRLRFWRLALESIGACWIDRLSIERERTVIRESAYEGDGPMQSLLQDVRYAFRLMWKSPGFTLAATATLALGIGANSAIFSLLNVLSLKPLSYRDPSRVAFVLGWDEQEGMRFNLRLADYLDLQERSQSFEAAAAYQYLSANLTGGDIPERVQAYRVTANTFATLGVPAALGRALQPSDAHPTPADVVVISHGLWQRRFGGDPSTVGRRVEVNGTPHEIVGVMPPRFEFPVFNFKGDVWIPWSVREGARGQTGSQQSATVVARIRPDVSYERAQAELDSIMRAIAAAHPDTNRGLGARLVEMGRLDDEYAGPASAILFVTVALVLLLACANVANLLLARGVSRYRELAVRAAIGATRRRIFRQLIVEALLLALAGGTTGILLAMVAVAALYSTLPDIVLTTQPNIDELGLDRVTLAYSFGVSVLTSLLFGFVPAWRAARGDYQDGLKESPGTGGSRGTRRLRTMLVVAEVALSTMLLIAAGLLVRSYAGLQRVNPGFDPSDVLTMTVALPEYKYPDGERQRQFYERSLERIERLPGVQSAGFVNVLPFSTYDRGTRLIVDGAPPPEPGREPAVSFRIATPRYLETLRIPILEGRGFDARDTPAGARVALVNRTLARRFLGAQSSLGRRVRFGRDEGAPWLEIVGVVGDVHHAEVTRAPDPEIYIPLAQEPADMMMLAVRGSSGAEPLAGAVRAAIHAVDPAQPVYHVKTMEQLVADSMLAGSTSAALMALFGGLALALAAIGVYGVIAYSVNEHRREFGLRLALGATPRGLLARVLRQGLVMVVAGILAGVGFALAVSRLIAGALFGVTPADPMAYTAAIGLLLITALVACAAPAWRAARVDPAAALRAE